MFSTFERLVIEVVESFELDTLISREKEASDRKQSVYQKRADMVKKTNAARITMMAAWEERCRTREEMYHEFDTIQHSSDNYREVWSEYHEIREENDATIKSLCAEANAEHQAMKECFKSASSEYEYGDRDMARAFAAKGHRHKKRRNKLNKEVGRLIQENRDARASAECRAPKTDSTAFNKAREAYIDAKFRYLSALEEYKKLEDDLVCCTAEFASVQEEHICLEEELQSKLAEKRASNQRNPNTK